MTDALPPTPPEGCTVQPFERQAHPGAYRCFHPERGLLYWSLYRWFQDHSGGDVYDWRHIGAELSKQNTELTKENNLQKQALIDMSRHNADLKREAQRLKKFEPKVTLFDCTQGRHEWERVPKTDQRHKCRRCGLESGK